MSADKIKSSLTLEQVEYLLRALGAEEVHIKGDTVISNTICHNEKGGKLKLWYNDTYKSFRCFTGCSGHSYSVYDLVIQVYSLKGISISFKESLDWVKEKLGIEDEEKRIGFGVPVYGKTTFQQSKREELEIFELLDKAEEKSKKIEMKLEFYSEYHLEQFLHHGSDESFTSDNINSDAMDKFGIKLDTVKNCLIIPHRYYENGKLVGLIARNLGEEQVSRGFKYIPYQNSIISYRYPKHLNLYGAWENRETIKTLGKIALFEAEKSVMQCESYFGKNNFACALGGSALDDNQIAIMEKLGAKEVFLCLDKDYERADTFESAHVLNNMVKLAKRLIPYFTVHIVTDNNNLLGYKDSPSDRGLGVLLSLFKDKQTVTFEFITAWESYISSL